MGIWCLAWGLAEKEDGKGIKLFLYWRDKINETRDRKMLAFALRIDSSGALRLNDGDGTLRSTGDSENTPMMNIWFYLQT